MAEPLIEAVGVSQVFQRGHGLFTRGGAVHAVREVSLAVQPGEVLAVVGESGSGKSTLGRMLLGLLPPSSGTVRFRGAALGSLHGAARQEFRRSVQVVFQDTGGSLNPRHTVAETLAVPLRWNLGLSRRAAAARGDALLEQVGLPPAQFRDRRPHELSGGQRQRVGIARALACEPALVVADEPVSALDVSVRAQILQLLRDLQQARGLAYVFITHDLGAVRAIADRAVVMQGGRVVESGAVADVLDAPQHSYTRALLAAVPAVR